MLFARVINSEFLPSTQTLAEAAAAGLRNIVTAHLDGKNDRAKHREGFPRSGYYTEAADSVQAKMLNDHAAVVSIQKEGIFLHYVGGVIYPKPPRKYLAIPVNPAVWDQNPSEYDPSREKLHPVGGKLRDQETDEIYYQLVKSATIKADPDVLPSDAAMYDAMFAAMEGVL